MMQVASDDTYDDYVICRGFDPRILRFIDYAAGDSNKPGISVAKPFGKRTAGTYEIGEIYPAFLPTQGNANFQDFRQVVFTPPSPVDVNWRVGQNPGVVTGGLEGGQPEGLSDTIGILYDHNGKVVNWLLIDSNGGGGAATIQFTVDSVTIAGTDSPYNGKKVATVTIEVAPCSRSELIGTSTEVVDWSECVWDLDEADLLGVWGWATEYVSESLESGADPGTLTPCHWGADDRCCVDADTAAPVVLAPGVVSSSVNYTLNAATDTGVLMDASGGSRKVNLPPAALNANVEFFIKKVDSGGYSVIVDPSTSETIDGEITQVLTEQYSALTVYSDGIEWHIL